MGNSPLITTYTHTLQVGQCIGQKRDHIVIDTLILKENGIRGQGCLNLVNSMLGVSTGVEQLRSLNLIKLDVSKNRIGMDGAKAIVKLLNAKGSKLQFLNVSDNNLGNLGAKPLLYAIANNSTLTTVDLSRNNISNGNMVAYMLKKNTHATKFDISWNLLRGKDAVQVASSFVDNYVVEQICLQFNAFGAFGAIALARAATSNHMLQNINLGYNGVTSQCCEELASLLREGHFQCFVLDGNPLGAQGIKTIANKKKTDMVISMNECAGESTSVVTISSLGPKNVNENEKVENSNAIM